jgi:Flp pilus assembly protein TadB
MTYWKYFFQPGMTLVLLTTFVFAIILGCVMLLIDATGAAVSILAVWLQFVLFCMFLHYLKWKRYKTTGNE